MPRCTAHATNRRGETVGHPSYGTIKVGPTCCARGWVLRPLTYMHAHVIISIYSRTANLVVYLYGVPRQQRQFLHPALTNGRELLCADRGLKAEKNNRLLLQLLALLPQALQNSQKLILRGTSWEHELVRGRRRAWGSGRLSTRGKERTQQRPPSSSPGRLHHRPGIVSCAARPLPLPNMPCTHTNRICVQQVPLVLPSQHKHCCAAAAVSGRISSPSPLSAPLHDPSGPDKRPPLPTPAPHALAWPRPVIF